MEEKNDFVNPLHKLYRYRSSDNRTIEQTIGTVFMFGHLVLTGLWFKCKEALNYSVHYRKYRNKLIFAVQCGKIMLEEKYIRLWRCFFI